MPCHNDISSNDIVAVCKPHMYMDTSVNHDVVFHFPVKTVTQFDAAI